MASCCTKLWETILKIDMEADRIAINHTTLPLHAENKIYLFLSERKMASDVIIKWYIRTATKLA